jgi:hypothetical protein
MIPFWAWSWILTVIGATGLLLAGKKVTWAWLVGLGAQVLWIAYALATKQYGFLASAGIYGAVYLRNHMLWRAEVRGSQSE